MSQVLVRRLDEVDVRRLDDVDDMKDNMKYNMDSMDSNKESTTSHNTNYNMTSKGKDIHILSLHNHKEDRRRSISSSCCRHRLRHRNSNRNCLLNDCRQNCLRDSSRYNKFLLWYKLRRLYR